LEDFQNAGLNPGEITKEDEELDSALKMAHLDMYKTKLRERERRKRVARDHQLISENKQIDKRAIHKREILQRGERTNMCKKAGLSVLSVVYKAAFKLSDLSSF
jgi:hypothetical protein